MRKDSREPHERFKTPSWWINTHFVWNHRDVIGPNHNAFLSRMKREMARKRGLAAADYAACAAG